MMLRWPFARRREVEIERARPERGRRHRGRVEWVDPQSAYQMWAGSYPPRPHNPLMEVEQETVLALLPDVRGLTALDAGCGSGRYLRELGDRGARTIGMDLSPAMIARAKETTTRIARADLRALPFAAMSIDLVVCGLALGDLAEIELALTEIARVLRPGGRVIYSVVHPGGEAAGWSRTFESNGRTLAIDGYWHSLERHRHACRAAGLAIEEWREPSLAAAPEQPAVLIVRAHVEGSSNGRRTPAEPV
jgi:malonyl-CoA O-methyltransferase